VRARARSPATEAAPACPQSRPRALALLACRHTPVVRTRIPPRSAAVASNANILAGETVTLHGANFGDNFGGEPPRGSAVATAAAATRAVVVEVLGSFVVRLALVRTIL
jgi:hypothetical protein